MWERERAAWAEERSSFAQERAGWEGERRRLLAASQAPRSNPQGEEEGMPEQEVDGEEEAEGEKSRKREEARMALRRELERDACSQAPVREGSVEREGKRMRVE